MSISPSDVEPAVMVVDKRVASQSWVADVEHAAFTWTVDGRSWGPARGRTSSTESSHWILKPARGEKGRQEGRINPGGGKRNQGKNFHQAQDLHDCEGGLRLVIATLATGFFVSKSQAASSIASTLGRATWYRGMIPHYSHQSDRAPLCWGS